MEKWQEQDYFPCPGEGEGCMLSLLSQVFV